MSVFFICLLISISLSMDAFSLALVYGTYGISFNRQILLSIVVSMFHFFMPLIGFLFGNYFINDLIIDSNYIVGIIFFIIGIEMIISFKKDVEVKFLTSFLGYLIFGFSVSIDSLTTGIGLAMITNHYVLAAIMFMICSGIFTFCGLMIGDKLNQNFGKYACFIGGIMMIILSIYYCI